MLHDRHTLGTGELINHKHYLSLEGYELLIYLKTSKFTLQCSNVVGYRLFQSEADRASINPRLLYGCIQKSRVNWIELNQWYFTYATVRTN